MKLDRLILSNFQGSDRFCFDLFGAVIELSRQNVSKPYSHSRSSFVHKLCTGDLWNWPCWGKFKTLQKLIKPHLLFFRSRWEIFWKSAEDRCELMAPTHVYVCQRYFPIVRHQLRVSFNFFNSIDFLALKRSDLHFVHRLIGIASSWAESSLWVQTQRIQIVRQWTMRDVTVAFSHTCVGTLVHVSE